MRKLVTVTALLLAAAALVLPVFAQVDPTATTQPSSATTGASPVAPTAIPHETDDTMTDATPMPQMDMQASTTVDFINGSFVNLAAALQASELTDTLASGEYTVFAPNDGAFLTLTNDLEISLNDLLENQPLLEGVLLYHVVPGIITSEDLMNGMVGAVETAHGNALTFGFDFDTSRVTLNGGQASIEQADIRTSNGIVHIIDNVLLPSNATELMLNPVLPGTDTTVEAGMGKTLTAISQDSFVLLPQAVQAAGLTDELASGEYTLFAPNDGAFLTLLNDLDMSYNTLLADQTLLQNVLSYHLVPGTVTVEDIQGGMNSLQTVNGAMLNFGFNTDTSRVTINGGAASVEYSDIFASNGVVHIIDNVLLPPQ